MLKNIVTGKKTITSCIVAAIVAILQYMGFIDLGTADILYKLAEAMGIYGIYDKVKRTAE